MLTSKAKSIVRGGVLSRREGVLYHCAKPGQFRRAWPADGPSDRSKTDPFASPQDPLCPRSPPAARLRVAGQPDLVGRARILTDLEGFAVACAAILLESGVRKEAVVEFMAGLSDFPVGKRRDDKHPVYAVQKAFEARGTPAEAMLADWTICGSNSATRTLDGCNHDLCPPCRHVSATGSDQH